MRWQKNLGNGFDVADQAPGDLKLETGVSASLSLMIWPWVGILLMYPIYVFVRLLRGLRLRLRPVSRPLAGEMTKVLSLGGVRPPPKPASRVKSSHRRHTPPLFIRSAMCASCSCLFTPPHGVRGSMQCPTCGQTVEV
jgi:hypothetical protein